MKKILTVFDGAHFSMAALEFARKLNESEPILMTGVFLPSIDYYDAMAYYLGGITVPAYLNEISEDIVDIDRNIEKFESYCIKHGIEHRIHRNYEVHVVTSLEKETRYADLLILCSETFYENLGSEEQEEYLKETMHKAECPVVIVPENYEFPQNVIIAYDGSASSVFAMKQFIYLFPALLSSSTLIVYSSDKNDNFPDLSYIEEYAARHFKDLTFFKLEANPSKYFGTWLADRSGALLVTGGYGRSGISQLFKKEFARDLLRDHKMPVFIAHP